MCKGCWEVAGSHAIITTKTKYIAECIDVIYNQSGGGAGGPAHVVVDDWNLDTETIVFCLNENKKGGIHTPLHAAVDRCLNELLEVTKEERYSAMAIHAGFIG